MRIHAGKKTGFLLQIRHQFLGKSKKKAQRHAEKNLAWKNKGVCV